MSLDRPLFSADPDAADRRTRPCTYTACDRAAPCQRYRRCSRARPWPLAERPDLIPCTASGDSDLARDLAAAARNPRSTWCVTVTDSQGHAIGRGSARPASANAPGSTPNQINRTVPIRPAGPGSPSPPPASPARPAGVKAAGGSPPGSPGSATCSWTSSRSPPKAAITGTRPRVMIPVSSSGTSPRSGTPHAPAPAASAPPSTATSNTISRTKPGDEPVCATATQNAASTHRVKQDPRWKAEQLEN